MKSKSEKSEAECLHAMAAYCSTAERCVYDVKQKIAQYGLPEEVEKQIIDRLKREKFLDEERFCRSFINDKMNFNRWGRIKIGFELRKRNIAPDTYATLMENIDDEKYFKDLTSLLKEKKRTTKGKSERDIFYKLCRFAAGRGFEQQLIFKSLGLIFNNINDDYNMD